MEPTKRVIVLIDMDCFYCQVEEKLNPLLKDKPIAVVQYNAWQGGGIIAVNYPARDEGVTRHMRGSEAKKKCPSINLVQVPEVRGKADLTKYRDAGKEVADVLATFTPLLQRASVDEAYLDITEFVENEISTNLKELCIENMANTFVVGSELKDFLANVKANQEFSTSNLKLAVGGLITEKIRREVFEKTGYRCSAGIAHNKILAKLVCSYHKPNKQTILPQDAVEKLFETVAITKITGLGGKFGQSITEDFQIQYMSELARISEKQLMQKFDEKTANWLYNLARGIDKEPVTQKLLSKSIACCKNFPGTTALTTAENVEQWLSKLSEEMSERLEKDVKENNRKAKQIILSFIQEINKKDISSSRSHPLISYDAKKICRAAFEVLRKHCLRSDGSYHVKFLGLSASHFQDVKNVREITSFFQVGQSKTSKNKSPSPVLDENNENVHEDDTFASGDEETNEDIFQQVTQELNENPNELVFFNNSNESFDIAQGPSTSTELNPRNSPDSTVDLENLEANGATAVLNKSSFFTKFFVSESPNKNEPEYSVSDLSQENDETAEDICETCIECQKKIPTSDMISHQDYHFALKLSRDQRPSQKTENTHKSEDKSSASKKGRPKGVKRKVDNNTSIINFITKNDEESSSLTETCPECNRKIKLEEVSSHMDYHTAKKIHLEINAVNTLKTSKPTVKKGPKGKSQSSNMSVISFFKPV